MGRIRTDSLKKLGNELLEKFSDRFTDNFDKNKEIIDELINLESKKIRNRLTGYITHIIKSRKKT